jgi:hypothetical protein
MDYPGIEHGPLQANELPNVDFVISHTLTYGQKTELWATTLYTSLSIKTICFIQTHFMYVYSMLA